MSDVVPPRLKRIEPGTWVGLAWAVGLVLTLVFFQRLPGESEAADLPASQLYRWDGVTTLVLATALTLVGCARLQRRPLLALTLMLLGAALAPSALGEGELPLLQFLAVDVAVYFIAAGHPRRTGITAAAMAVGTLAAYLTVRLSFGWTIGLSTELSVALTTVVAWLIGNSAYQARQHAEELRTRATVQAVTDERLRIARELHDVVAHTIGIVALQAGAARRVIDTQPARAREALAEVENASRETLAGLRHMLGALREAAEPDRPAPIDDAPGLADLDALAAATTAAGVRVAVAWRGTRRPLPPEIDLAAYRIAQEAVTNVVRHAGVRVCGVTVSYGTEELVVEVIDEGQAPAGGAGRGRSGGTGTGYGLVGMRERVALLHGEFEAGPRPEGGFRVAARLPLPAPAGDRFAEAATSSVQTPAAAQ
ncbi:sensor histidine kinase [Streptomyces sp. A7024]|uniref:histidine kinase n=1 Tax=Streptomyces coryli TaxID=1128680 RepID=A0A6G4U9Y9_9ACTN|nr:histidine kinase [Streptomyces coryli]NGN68001.1 sensor histidine kinase [Streptomyces coryli]